jgi:hypothetical protein
MTVDIRRCMGEHRDRGTWRLIAGFYLRGHERHCARPQPRRGGHLAPTAWGGGNDNSLALAKPIIEWGEGPHVIDTKRMGEITYEHSPL